LSNFTAIGLSDIALMLTTVRIHQQIHHQLIRQIVYNLRHNMTVIRHEQPGRDCSYSCTRQWNENL